MQSLRKPSVMATMASALACLPALAQTPNAEGAAPPDAGASAPIQATTGDPGSPSAVEQIVVTANKRRELQREIANSVTAISGRDLDRRQEINLQDIASQVPGLSLEADDKTQLRVVLRGLNAGGGGATVASVLDDIPTNPSGAQNQAAINTPNFDTYDLQRIEVLKGPQGTLYGATAEGGLIKYVTNPPDPTAYSGAIEGGIDGTTAGGIGGSLKGYGNFPLLDGKAAVRLTGWDDYVPGYVDNPERGKSNANSGQQYGWRASLLVTPTPELTVRLTAERQSLFSNASDSIEAVGSALTPLTPPANQLALVNGLVNNTALPTLSQNESAVYYGSINYDLGWSTLTSLTSFAYTDFNNRFDLSNANVAAGLTYAAYVGGNVYGVPSLVNERQNSNTDKFNQEIRLTSNPGSNLFGHRFDWLVGGYYTHETETLLQFVDALSAEQPSVALAPAAGGISLYGQLSEWAFFANTDYFITPSIDIALGGRLAGTAQHSQATDTCCVFFGPTGTLPEYRSNDHDQLFSVAPRWRITDDTMLYARIATGYRPGGPNLPIPGITGLPTNYGPDRTTNYELGWRQDFFNKAVAVDVTGFYITWKDIQVLSTFNTPSGIFSSNGNAGSAISKGVEWSITWVPLTGLRLNAVGAYTDARLAADAAGLGAFDGQFLPYVPAVTSSVNADYGWRVMDRFRAYVSGTWSYTGERYTSFSPTTTVTNSHTLLSGYHTGALRAGLEDSHYGLEFFVNNISDTRGITYYANNGGAGETGQVTIIQPRTIGLVARVKF